MNTKATKIAFSLFTSLFLLLFNAISVHAVDIESIFFSGRLANRTLADFVTPIIQASILFAAIITFLLFIGGGVMMISSAGNPQKKQQASSALTASVVGLVLVFSAYWIVQLLEVLTGLNFLDPGL